MQMTGPEHAEHAEALLSGKARWPHKMGDRMAAAQAHAVLALVSLVAHTITENDCDQNAVDARNYDWRTALPLPYMFDYDDLEEKKV
jgi:hypothetical protein